jgi:hypothetical protein
MDNESLALVRSHLLSGSHVILLMFRDTIKGRAVYGELFLCEELFMEI